MISVNFDIILTLAYCFNSTPKHFKGALCSFGEEIKSQNFNIYCIHEVIIQTKKYLFFP